MLYHRSRHVKRDLPRQRKGRKVRITTDPASDEAVKIAFSLARETSASAWVDGLIRQELGRLAAADPALVRMFGWDDEDSMPRPDGAVSRG